jgi:hypothetical protein
MDGFETHVWDPPSELVNKCHVLNAELAELAENFQEILLCGLCGLCVPVIFHSRLDLRMPTRCRL